MNIIEKIKEDWQLKLLAFLMALILWLYVVRIADNKDAGNPEIRMKKDAVISHTHRGVGVEYRKNLTNNTRIK